LTPKGVRAVEHNCSNSSCLWAEELVETRGGGLDVHGDLLATRTRAVDAGDIAIASDDAKRYPEEVRHSTNTESTSCREPMLSY
jgi:hypothetical protein